VIAGLGTGSLVATASGASAATNPYERGPAPTATSIEAVTGPFATSKTTVSAFTAGLDYDGGTIYYPTTTTAGTFGAVVVMPGFTENQSAISWYGPRIASQGFVVYTIDTNSGSDDPTARSQEALKALDYLTTKSSVASRIDPSRTAVMGHSMGGGGTLEAAKARPSLKAAIPLAGWDTQKSFSTVTVPTMIVAAQNDLIAPVAEHSKPFYNSLPSTTSKAYLELRGASHTTSNSPNTTIARFTISWLKRWVDSDTRYSPFLCNVSTSTTISAYNSNCPF
jgi:dienelactone hydrolase